MGSYNTLRIVGIMLIFFGLFVTTLAFVQDETDGDSLIFAFPFIFSGVSGLTAVALTLLFAGIFIVMSFLPWLLFRESPKWGEYSPLDLSFDTKDEDMDYIITVEIPDHVRRRILIEGEGGVLWLKSGADRGFTRSYSLPDGFEVDEYEYEYEGSYLVLKLRLRKRL